MGKDIQESDSMRPKVCQLSHLVLRFLCAPCTSAVRVLDIKKALSATFSNHQSLFLVFQQTTIWLSQDLVPAIVYFPHSSLEHRHWINFEGQD